MLNINEQQCKFKRHLRVFFTLICCHQITHQLSLYVLVSLNDACKYVTPPFSKLVMPTSKQCGEHRENSKHKRVM